MNIVQKYQTAPTTVKEAKLNIFAPFEKGVTEKIVNDIVYEDEHCKVTINGFKLNQIHRDILDIACYYGDNSLDARSSDIRPLRLFSLYDIQKHLKYKSKNQNSWIVKKFDEIQMSLISIEDKTKQEILKFSIIDVAKYSIKQKRYALIISSLYMKFFENEISINYKPYLAQILDLNSQTRALVRYILSHSNNFQIDLDLAMEKIGIEKNNISKQAFTKSRNRILDDEEKLKELNIFFTKKSSDNRKKDFIITYKKLKNKEI